MVRNESLLLASAPTAPGTARQFVRDHVRLLPAEQLEDVLILVSELVTNAVRHGRPEIGLTLTLAPTTLTVEVRDGGANLPVLPPHAASAPGHTNGRGLIIVDALATTWGIRPNRRAPGKTVWCEFARAG